MRKSYEQFKFIWKPISMIMMFIFSILAYIYLFLYLASISSEI